MSRLKAWTKEIMITAIAIFILENIISYFRQPELDFTTFPKEEFRLFDGTIYTHTKGKPLLVHFWATWCPTCKLEASNIQRVSEQYEVVTFAVNSGTDEKLQRYMQEQEFTFRVVNDREGTWAAKFNVEAYPTTFIFDIQSELQFTEVGYTSTVGLLGRMKLSE